MSRGRTWIPPIFPIASPAPTAPPNPRRDYILALIRALEKKVNEGGEFDDALADKIEALLGVPRNAAMDKFAAHIHRNPQLDPSNHAGVTASLREPSSPKPLMVDQQKESE